MDPACIVSIIQAGSGGIMVRGIYLDTWYELFREIYG